MDITITITKWTWVKYLAEGTSMAAPVAASVVNHVYGGGSILIDAFAVVLGLIALYALFSISTRLAFRGTVEEAKSYLDGLH